MDKEFDAWWSRQSMASTINAELLRQVALLAWQEAKHRSGFYYKVLNSQASLN
jgi:hypothetical protein